MNNIKGKGLEQRNNELYISGKVPLSLFKGWDCDLMWMDSII